MQKHSILFLAANPFETDRLALDREAREIQLELEQSGGRSRFEFVTRWAAEPMDLLRELRKLKPTVVHFSGHGGGLGQRRPETTSRLVGQRDVEGGAVIAERDVEHGLFFQGADGRSRLVSTEALQETFAAAGHSVRLVLLNACYSELQADSLAKHVACVVGMRGSICDDAARKFAIGFYGGLGEHQPVALAYKQGCAAIKLENLSGSDRPQLKVRSDLDANKFVLTYAHCEPSTKQTSADELEFAAVALNSTVVTPDSRQLKCNADPVFDVTILNNASSPLIVSSVGVKILRAAQTTCFFGAPRAARVIKDDAYALALPDICERLPASEIWDVFSPTNIGEAVHMTLPDPVYLAPGTPYRYSLLLRHYRIHMPSWIELVMFTATSRGDFQSIQIELINA